MRWMRFGVMLGALLLVSGHAGAANTRRVEEKNKAFSIGSLMIKRGERITLANSDDTTHSLFIPSMREIALKRQDPGENVTIQFDNLGIYEVRCNFHAKMRLLVSVQD